MGTRHKKPYKASTKASNRAAKATRAEKGEDLKAGPVATLTPSKDIQAYQDRRTSPHKQPVSDKIQPYDQTKGFDLTKYDLRKGEIGHPAIPHPKAFMVAPAPANQSTGLCVECGKGVAPGQNYLCREHVRYE